MDELPTSFGKQEEKNEIDTRYAQLMRPDYKSRLESKNNSVKPESNLRSSSESETGSDSDSDVDAELDQLPISHEMKFKPHEKSITSISSDPLGNRFVTSSKDCTFRLFEYQGMNPSSKQPFKIVQPFESNIIDHAKFSPNGKNIIVTSSLPNFKIFTRDGIETCSINGGFTQMADLKNTNGHLAPITSCSWNPNDSNFVLTVGKDASVRIWDLNNHKKHKDIIVVKSKSRDFKISEAIYSTTGGVILSDSDSTLSIYDSKNFNRPSQCIKSESSIVSLLVNPQDPDILLTRSLDGLKMYDLRNFKQPLLQNSTFSKNYSIHNCLSFSPCGKYVLGGVKNHLQILDKSDLSLLTDLAFENTITAIDWNGSTNEIIIGQNDGTVTSLFSPRLSKKGIQLVIQKQPRKRHIDDGSDFSMDQHSINKAIFSNIPNQDRHIQVKAITTNAEIAPVSYKDGSHDEEVYESEDPREALLKYSEKAIQITFNEIDTDLQKAKKSRRH